MSIKPDATQPSEPAQSGERPSVRKASDPREADTVAPPTRSGVNHSVPIPKAPALPGGF